MFSANEIKNAVDMYNLMKKDLHTLLVKKSFAPLDYEGKIANNGSGVVYIEYGINDDRESYEALIEAGKIIENMMKIDVRLWNKTQRIKYIEVAPDHWCGVMVMEILFV